MKRIRRRTIVTVLVFFAAWSFWYFKFAGHHLRLEQENVPARFWGVTFSKKYATELGLSWRDAYTAVIEDLGATRLRLPVYWDEVEADRGVFRFDDYDWMMREGEARGVSFIIAAGRRLPRWPECHQPQWTQDLSDDEMKKRHLSATKAVIDHFKNFKAVEFWQIENEYFFPFFGLCPKADSELLRDEIAYLKSVDARPVILTDSGELNSWRQAARHSDILGVTMYRNVWNKYFGYMRNAWPAWFYRLKAVLVGSEPQKTMVIELQAEPWPSRFRSLTEIDRREADRTFSLRQFETNSELARRTGFSRAYFWGVEWWYWLKTRGDDSMWRAGKAIITGR